MKRGLRILFWLVGISSITFGIAVLMAHFAPGVARSKDGSVHSASTSQILHREGIEALQSGDVSVAKLKFRESLLANPDNIGSQRFLYDIYMASGERRKAVPLLRSMLGHGPQVGSSWEVDPTWLLEASEIARSEGDSALSSLCVERAASVSIDLAGSPRVPYVGTNVISSAYFNASLSHRSNGNFGKATTCLETAIETEPNNTTLRLALAEVRIRTGDLAQAKEQLIWCKLHPISHPNWQPAINRARDQLVRKGHLTESEWLTIHP